MIEIVEIQKNLNSVLAKLEEEYESELDYLTSLCDQEPQKHGFSEYDFKNLRSEGDTLFKNNSIINTSAPIEKKIYHYVRHYSQADTKDELDIKDVLLKSVGCYRKVIYLQNALNSLKKPPSLDALLFFSPFWIRDPFEWSGKDAKSLLEHLFVEYPVPEPLFNEWYIKDGTLNQKWICWFIILSQGGSLKEASKLFGWNIYSKFQHFYVQQDSRVETQKEASIRAEIKRMSGSSKLSSYLKHNLAYFIDPTDPEVDKKFLDFWYRTVEWLIRYYDELEHEQIGAILDWAMHNYTEEEREKKTFSWKGRALHNVIRLSGIYAIKNTLKGRDVRWNSHNMDWEYKDNNNDAWIICEITTAKELFKEALELQHCANEYLDRCLSGHTAVFSMRCNHVRTVTIEVELSKRIIKQARGKKNRELKKSEREVLKRWCHTLIERRRKQTLKETEIFEFLLKRYKFESLYSLNYRGNTILHEIVKKGAIKDLEIVIQAGLPVDFENDLGETPLMTAVKLRKRDMVSLLTNAGADVNYGLSASRNVLTYAFQAGNSLIVRDLLKCGAAIKPHHAAQGASGKQKIMFNLLVKHRGDLNMKTTSG